MTALLMLLGCLLSAAATWAVLTMGKRGRRSRAVLMGVTRLIFVTTQISALLWVYTSYGIAIYSTVRLGQVYTMAELSEPAIHTILGVGFLKVLENIFEHNDGPVFGRTKQKDPPEGGKEDTYESV